MLACYTSRVNAGFPYRDLRATHSVNRNKLADPALLAARRIERELAETDRVLRIAEAELNAQL